MNFSIIKKIIKVLLIIHRILIIKPNYFYKFLLIYIHYLIDIIFQIITYLLKLNYFVNILIITTP